MGSAVMRIYTRGKILLWVRFISNAWLGLSASKDLLEMALRLLREVKHILLGVDSSRNAHRVQCKAMTIVLGSGSTTDAGGKILLSRSSWARLRMTSYPWMNCVTPNLHISFDLRTRASVVPMEHLLFRWSGCDWRTTEWHIYYGSRNTKPLIRSILLDS